MFSFEGVSPVFLVATPPICDVAEVAIIQKDDLARSGYRELKWKKSSIFLATYLLEDMIFFSRIWLVKENPREILFFLAIFQKTLAIQQKLAQKKKKNTGWEP